MQIKENNGWIIISTIVNGYYTTRRYMYYTKKEAIKAFKKSIKDPNFNQIIYK